MDGPYKVKVCSAVEVLKMARTKDCRVKATPRYRAKPKGMRFFIFFVFVPAGDAETGGADHSSEETLRNQGFQRGIKRKNK